MRNIDWKDISVSRYKEVFNIKKADFNTEDEYNVFILSILYNQPEEFFLDLDFDEYREIISTISILNTTPNLKPKQVISTTAGLLYLLPYESLEFGAFIDIENLSVSSFIDNLSTILAIFYRTKDIKKSLLYIDTYESYGDWIFHRATLFDDVSINDVYGVLVGYLKYREELMELYEGLFEESSSKTTEEINEELSTKKLSITERNEIQKADEKDKAIKKWGWDRILLKMANDNPLELDKAGNLLLIQVFNILSLRKELGIE